MIKSPFLVLAAIAFLASCASSSETLSSGDQSLPASEQMEEEAFNADESSPYTDGKYNGSAKREHDLIHTKLNVSFDWPNAHLIGEAWLTLKPYFYSKSEVELDAKGFDINKVALVEPDGSQKELDYDYDNLKLLIQLPKSYTKTETYQLYIDYVAKPNELPEGGSLAITSDKGLYFINEKGENKDKPRQLWTQGETEASSCWFPTIDKPNERTTQEMAITVDENFITLSNGAFTGSEDNGDGTRTDSWEMDEPHAPYLFMMAISEFAVVKDSWKGIPVNYYVDPEYEPYAQLIFGNTPEMMTFYSDILGVDYPWDKYSQVVVHDFVSGAMENTSATIHFDGLHMTDREYLDETHEDIIAHELVHHWFGDLVTCESWANLPLNESFATYGEYLWIEYKYGREEADLHIESDLQQYMMESGQKQVDLVRFDYGDKEQMFDGHSYQKGGRVLHMLRKYVGDDAFFASLQKYLQDHAFTDVEMHELRIAFEDITGEDLNWFFNQWFFSSGHPQLEISYEQSEEGADYTLVVRQVQDREETPVYILPVDIDVYRDGEKDRQRIMIDRREMTFDLVGSAGADAIVFDAERQLLGEIEEDFGTMSESWNSWLLENGELYLDRRNALDYFAELSLTDDSADEMVQKALRDPFWAIQEDALGAIEINSATPVALLDEVEDLAINHVKSDVRATALNVLMEVEGDKYENRFMNSMQDSSWMVVATALAGVGQSNSDKALELAAEYEEMKNLEMMLTVMGLYAEYGGADKNDYFMGRLEAIGGWMQYFVIQNYGTYLERIDDDQIVRDGSQALADAASDSDFWWMTQVARGTLVNIKEKYENLRDDIAESEIDSSRLAALEENISTLDNILSEM